jgi:hypothetical protein
MKRRMRELKQQAEAAQPRAASKKKEPTKHSHQDLLDLSEQFACSFFSLNRGSRKAL